MGNCRRYLTFYFNYSINYLLRNEDFPSINVDAELINGEASIYTKSGIAKEELINEYIVVRSELLTFRKNSE
jgi:hypothetical protein